MSGIKQSQSHYSHKELASRLGITESEMVTWHYQMKLVKQLRKLGLKSQITFRAKTGTIGMPK
jgi:hypothetical protein